MYSKDQLLEKNASELENIAKELEAEYDAKASQEEIIYAILDRQAIIESNKNPLTTKRKRTRIAKKDTDRVYSVNGTEGENFDVKKGKAATEQPLFKEVPAAEQLPEDPKAKEDAEETATPEPPKPKRGRPRKVKAPVEEVTPQPEVPAEEKAEDTDATIAEQETPEEVDMKNAEIPEAAFATGEMIEQSEDDGNLIAQLQAKINAHNEEQERIEEPVNMDNVVWEGDPGNGTDFITVIDLPIEDRGAVPTFDMFDNPTTPIAQMIEPYQPVAPQNFSPIQTSYDFDDLITANGVLEIMPDGYGFLRSSDYNYLSSPDDVYVANTQIKRYGLKTGDVVQCHVRPPHDGEKYFPLTSIDKINGRVPAEVRDRVAFEHLTPLFPEEKFTICGDAQTTNLSTRIVDLFSPIGKGQRALIVAQPKTGKTILMKDIANAIAANHPEAYIMMLLIDERPEEVTDMARTVNAEVIASTFDEPAERHVKIAGIVLEKAKRMVECGHDVVIFLDSITRLARAYNTVSPASGKVLTGGVDANALQKPKRFFGAARNIEGGGSLTIIATALVDTGSKMDEVIFEEFKGTGNSEIQLDRSLSNKRIFPSVNLVASSTRRDDLLQDKTTLDRMWILRKYISDMNPIEAMNTIHDTMLRTKDNDEFLLSMNS